MARPSHPLRDAGLALALLTVVPTGAEMPADEETQVAAWFPAVGALFGLVGYGLVKLADLFRIQYRAPLVAAGVIVLAWALASRMLHFDGLADVADAFWGSHDRDRRLEIMADSRTGAFGATAVALAAVLEVAAVGAIIGRPHELPLLVTPVISRFSATAAAWLGTPSKPAGLGRSVLSPPSGAGVVVGMVPLMGAFAAMWLGFRVTGLAVAMFGLVVAFAMPHVLARRFGGVNGDVMGASVLITEALLLAAMAVIP